MGLYDDLVKESESSRGKAVCSVAKIREQCKTEGERADLDRALLDRRIYGAAIARKLVELYQIPIKGQTVQRHRNGECCCG